MGLHQNLEECDRKCIDSLKSFEPKALNMMIFLDHQELQHLEYIEGLLMKWKLGAELKKNMEETAKYLDILKHDINNHIKCLNIAEYEILEEMENASTSK